MLTRETVYAAVYAKVSSSSTFVTKSRTVKHWADVPKAEQPALFFSEGNESAERRKGFPTVWTLTPQIILYAATLDDDTQSPGQILNPMLDAIEACFEPDPGREAQTLNDLVYSISIYGTVERDQGFVGGQGVAIIPLRIIFAA